MHRYRLLLALVLILSFALAAQAQDDESPVTLNVIGLRVIPDEVGTPLDLARQGFITDFQEMYPNITVNALEAPPDVDTQLLVDLAAGTAPDVWYQDASTLSRLVDAGNILDMNVCIELVPELDLDRFSPTFLAIHEREDAIWGLPDGGTPMVIYYNPESFERAGIEMPSSDWTWDDFLLTAQMLTLDSEGRNRLDADFDEENVVQWGYRMRRFVFEWIYWTWQNGGDVIAPDGSTVDGYLNSPESVEAITFLRDLVLEHGVAPAPSTLDQISQQFGFLSTFLRGDVAMFPRGHWEMVGLRANPDYTPERVAVVGLPSRVDDVTVIYESGWFINSAVQDDEAKLLAACRLVEQLTDVGFQSSKVITGLEISANAAAAESAITDSEFPEISRVFVDEIANGRRPYGSVYAVWPLVEEALNLMMESILAGVDVMEEIETAVQEIDRELARAQR